MPIIVGNSTVNSAITSTSVSENTPQGFAEYNATRNSVMPSLRLDFVNSNVLDPRITFTRASNATYFSSAGVLTTALNNIPRFDYNPATLACNGLLIEQSSTNVVLNSGATGAVVGTPGINPTNWIIGAVFGATGLSTSIIGTGTESGIPYVDVRFFGTPTGTGNGQRAIFTLSAGTVVGAQVWTGSVYCTLVGGNLTNVGYFLLEVSSGNPAFNGNSLKAFTPTASALNNSRVSTSYTLPTGSTTVGMDIVMGFTINLPIDVTIRIAAPQLELLPFATSFITTPSAATASRAADVASIPLGTLFNSNAFTVYTENIMANITPVEYPRILVIDNGSSVVNGIQILTTPTSNPPVRLYAVIGSAGGFTSGVLLYTAGAITKGALSVSSSSAYIAWNGATPVANNTAFGTYTPSSFTTLWISAPVAETGGSTYCGWARRIILWTQALSNNELISLTS
jgi:hypothetical protein